MSSELPSAKEPGLPPASVMPAGEANELAARVAALESRFSPNSWLYGPNFLKRAFAMYGHILVAGFIIGIIVSVIFAVCSTIFGLSLMGLGNR